MTSSTYYDNFLILGVVATLPGTFNRDQTVYDLRKDSSSLHRNIGVIISFDSSESIILYEWQPSFFLTPEDTQNRPTDWLDCGTPHYKFIHGCRIDADTGGLTRTVDIQYDGGLFGPTLTISHTGEMIVPYTFPPFKARLVRLVPNDSSSWRLFSVTWEVDIEPEEADYWVTQPTALGLSGYGHIRDFQLAYATVNAGAVLLLIVDGVSTVLVASLASTGGVAVKQYFVAPPLKGKMWQFSLIGTALQVYGKDCEFRVKQWGGETYSVLKPIGDDSVTSGGAKI